MAPRSALRSRAQLQNHQQSPSLDRPVGQLVGEFHQQMEKILFEAAGAAVRERATSALDEVRQGLREEAKTVLTELASSQTGPWIEQSLKQLNGSARKAPRPFTRRGPSDWTPTFAARSNASRSAARNSITLAQSLSANALDRLQRGLESSREEGVDRIVSRLKEQSAPVIDHAKETMAALAKQREELETVLDQALTKSTGKIEEVCSGFEKQFEMMIRERLDAAREELHGTDPVGHKLRAQTTSAPRRQQQEAEAQSRLQKAMEPVEAAIGEMKRRPRKRLASSPASWKIRAASTWNSSAPRFLK